jgi:hypothetical protein
LERIIELENSTHTLEEIPGLLPFKKVVPSKTTNQRVTQAHGSMRAKDIIKIAEELKQQKLEKSKQNAALEKREESKEVFYRCKEVHLQQAIKEL